MKPYSQALMDVVAEYDKSDLRAPITACGWAILGQLFGDTLEDFMSACDRARAMHGHMITALQIKVLRAQGETQLASSLQAGLVLKA